MVAWRPSLPALIFWRAVQGLVLPPIFAVTVAYIGDEWPAREATTRRRHLQLRVEPSAAQQAGWSPASSPT